MASVISDVILLDVDGNQSQVELDEIEFEPYVLQMFDSFDNMRGNFAIKILSVYKRDNFTYRIGILLVASLGIVYSPVDIFFDESGFITTDFGHLFYENKLETHLNELKSTFFNQAMKMENFASKDDSKPWELKEKAIEAINFRHTKPLEEYSSEETQEILQNLFVEFGMDESKKN